MQIFKDSAGNEWQIELNIQTAREIRRNMAAHAADFANVDFLDYATLLFSLNDIFFAADLLAIVCAKQREERQLDEAAFGAILRGKVLFDAIEAFTAEYLDFFPDPTTADKMRAVVEKNKKARQTIEDAICQEVTARLEEAVDSVAKLSGEVSSAASATQAATTPAAPA